MRRRNSKRLKNSNVILKSVCSKQLSPKRKLNTLSIHLTMKTRSVQVVCQRLLLRKKKQQRTKKRLILTKELF